MDYLTPASVVILDLGFFGLCTPFRVQRNRTAEVEDDYARARSCGNWSRTTAICWWYIMELILFN
jgi:hypothetical protein